MWWADCRLRGKKEAAFLSSCPSVAPSGPFAQAVHHVFLYRVDALYLLRGKELAVLFIVLFPYVEQFLAAFESFFHCFFLSRRRSWPCRACPCCVVPASIFPFGSGCMCLRTLPLSCRRRPVGVLCGVPALRPVARATCAVSRLFSSLVVVRWPRVLGACSVLMPLQLGQSKISGVLFFINGCRPGCRLSQPALSRPVLRKAVFRRVIDGLLPRGLPSFAV